MIKVFQTSFHDETSGTRGDCLRASVASILNLAIEEVPEFHKYFDTTEWFQYVIDFMQTKGYEYEGLVTPISSPEPKEQAISRLIQAYSKEGYSIDGNFLVFGTSPRGIYHCVIFDSNGMVHDPHPDGTGVTPDKILLFSKLNQN